MNKIDLFYKINYPVFLCIGSTNIIGDSFAPKVGSILIENNIKNVYGTINKAVNSKNLENTIKKIKEIHKNAPIIAIDAGLGKKSDIGKIKFEIGGINPRSAIDDSMPKIGSIHIIGIVAQFSGKKNTIESLNKSNLDLVNSMSIEASKKIIEYFALKKAK